MPFGSGHSIESQIIGQDSTGGIQIEVTPCNPLNPRIPIYIKTLTGKTIIIKVDESEKVHGLLRRIRCHEGIPHVEQRLIYAGRQLEDSQTVRHYGIKEHDTIHLVQRLRGGGGGKDYEMSVAAGGNIKQVIHPDTMDNDWLTEKTTVFNIQILNSAVYHTVTGKAPPNRPISAATYKKHGLPFFKMYEEPSGICSDFGMVKSIAELDGVKVKKVKPRVVVISNKRDRRGNHIRRNNGLTNPFGLLREFRLVADLEKELDGYHIADF